MTYELLRRLTSPWDTLLEQLIVLHRRVSQDGYIRPVLYILLYRLKPLGQKTSERIDRQGCPGVWNHESAKRRWVAQIRRTLFQ